ncbi:MAG TPA: adenylosuccinate synthase, partial [Ramlibacter sp.]|nr:adenylosuccinate synthase [Ramlibacter sp.]
GTTGRGIGPAYEDKIARRAVRVQDLKHPDRFADKLKVLIDLHNFMLTKYLNAPAVDYQQVLDEALKLGEQLKPMIADVSRELNEAHRNGDNLLFEGAQGTLLDVDHGTYPYVTSSNCVAGNAAAGAGVGPGMLHYILGITKAYCTRVGGGPFPTELDWETPGTVGYHLSTVGAEKGVTTGRSRRCGWFDAALLKRSAQVNGLSGLCITKLDVLDGLEELQLCTGYELDGEHIDILPLGADEISRCKPVYETLEGWTESTVGVTQYDKLPVNARLYLQRIEQVTGVPIDIISTSPDRDHTIMMRHPYLA